MVFKILRDLQNMAFKDVLFTQGFSWQWDMSAPGSTPHHSREDEEHQRPSIWNCFCVTSCCWIRNCPASPADRRLSAVWTAGHREVSCWALPSEGREFNILHSQTSMSYTETESQRQMLQRCRGNLTVYTGSSDLCCFSVYSCLRCTCCSLGWYLSFSDLWWA